MIHCKAMRGSHTKIRGSDRLIVQLKSSSSGRLQEGLELGTREDCLCLLQGLDLLVASSLADLEVLEDEVTAGVQLSLVVGKLLQFEHDGLLILLCFNKI